MRYDAIIVGASFAGLATAARLAGRRVLLVDRRPVGTHQSSACGTLVSTLVSLGLEDAILQTHDRIVIHTPGRTFVFPVAEPYCTFDYTKLCRRLREQGDAEFALATALGTEGNRVRTDRETFSGDLIVDASGWRAALTAAPAGDRRRREWLNFGLETTVAYRENGLHFWYDPKEILPFGVTWAFPLGERAHVGIGSYHGDTQLVPRLEQFMAGFGLQRQGLHGGFYTHRLDEPVVGDIFRVGDAAGQCLGLTGEGIRPALFFGTRLGMLLRRVVRGELAPDEAQSRYRALVGAYKFKYGVLCLAQRALPRLPLPLAQGLIALANRRAMQGRILARYASAFPMPSDLRSNGRGYHFATVGR